MSKRAKNYPKSIKILYPFVTDDHPAFVIHPGEIAEYFPDNDLYTFPARPLVADAPNSVKVMPSAAPWRVLRWEAMGRAEIVKEMEKSKDD